MEVLNLSIEEIVMIVSRRHRRRGHPSALFLDRDYRKFAAAGRSLALLRELANKNKMGVKSQQSARQCQGN